MAKPRLICVKCGLEMEIAQVGTNVVLMAWDPPAPYEIWSGDTLRCPGCGATVVDGFPDHVFCQHFEPEQRMAECVRRFAGIGKLVVVWERIRQCLGPILSVNYVTAWADKALEGEAPDGP